MGWKPMPLRFAPFRLLDFLRLHLFWVAVAVGLIDS